MPTALAGALTTVSVSWGGGVRAGPKQPYECGMEPTGDAREPFFGQVLPRSDGFLLFDVEAIFLYPWAYIFRSLRCTASGDDDLHCRPVGRLLVISGKKARWTA